VVSGFILVLTTTVTVNAESDSKKLNSFVDLSVNGTEARLLNDLDRNNTKIRRKALAWMRHDQAVAMFESYRRSGDRNELLFALSRAESATQLAPDVAQFWRIFGLLNLVADIGLVGEMQAEGAFRRILELKPEDMEARRLLIELLIGQREYGEAAQHFAFLFEFDPRAMIERDLTRMNMVLIKADLTGWGIKIYDRFIETLATNRGPGDDLLPLAIAKAELLKADTRDEEAAEMLLSVYGYTSGHGKEGQRAQELLMFWGVLP
jgi:tetratricopeptide (TPR) repeat protein